MFCLSFTSPHPQLDRRGLIYVGENRQEFADAIKIINKTECDNLSILLNIYSIENSRKTMFFLPQQLY